MGLSSTQKRRCPGKAAFSLAFSTECTHTTWFQLMKLETCSPTEDDNQGFRRCGNFQTARNNTAVALKNKERLLEALDARLFPTRSFSLFPFNLLMNS